MREHARRIQRCRWTLKRTLLLWSSSPGRVRAHARSRSAAGPSTSCRIANSDGTRVLRASVKSRLQLRVDRTREQLEAIAEEVSARRHPANTNPIQRPAELASL